ncbi:PREDICTED: probable cystathionine gamma-synthase, partial [Trachymyrmex cornetzi]|uniref:probable cystathionine gamma-synthase n=1 Tax=Trachymyrmex cornetzi TaxID=471704 RepID=UPI00084F05F0
LLKAGDHLIVGDELYGGTNSHIRKCSSRQGMTSTFVDMTDIQNIINAIQPNTKMIWLETP